MCTNFTPATRDEIAASRLVGLQIPAEPWPDQVFPGYLAPIVVRAEGAESPRCELARFGLIPPWCKDHVKATELSRVTYNARSETVAVKPSFQGAWRARQWALVPMRNFFEPCWEESVTNGGRSVRWQIALADGATFAAAGLWENWINPATGELIRSFTLLTVNADGHPLLGRMHKPQDEKRMLVILDPDHYRQWLSASPSQAKEMMHAMPAPQLIGAAAPRNVTLTTGSLF